MRETVHFGAENLPARFWDKAIPEPMSGCWLWIGATSDGYGYLRWPNGASPQRLGAHVIAVLASNRVIPNGWQVDHRCEVRCCVNPEHLDVVTHDENHARRHQRHPITHCSKGHEYTDENSYYVQSWNGYFHRKCRTCIKANSLARKE